jgi:hypothetical protein
MGRRIDLLRRVDVELLEIHVFDVHVLAIPLHHEARFERAFMGAGSCGLTPGSYCWRRRRAKGHAPKSGCLMGRRIDLLQRVDVELLEIHVFDVHVLAIALHHKACFDVLFIGRFHP